MGELKSSYDVVIVGNDLPALIFGALAAKNGYRVLLLGHGGRNNVYEENGFRFVRRPNLMYGFTEAPPISEVFRDLALLPEMRNRPRQFDPVCNVVMPERRLEISHVKDALDQEIEREFPKQAQTFRHLFNDLVEADPQFDPILRTLPTIPPRGIVEWFKWRKVRNLLEKACPGNDALESLGDDQAARTFLAAPVSILTGCPEAWETPLTFNRATNHLMRGLYNVEWGLDSLKSIFLSRIEGNSGTVRAGDFADVIQTQYGRVAKVDVLGRNEAIGTSMLVCGTDFESILDRLPEKSVTRRYRQKIADTAATHYMVTMNIGMARRGLPAGMSRNVFLVREPGKPLDADNLLTLQVDPAMEPSDTLDPERAVLSVTGLLPASLLKDTESVEEFCRRMTARVTEFMPFIDRHLVATSIPAIRMSEKTGKEVVDRMALVPVYGQSWPGMMGLVTRPIRTPFRNLLNLGESASGHLGFEGAFTAASMAFSILKKQLPKKDVIQHGR